MHSFLGRAQTFLLHCGLMSSAVVVRMKEQERRRRRRRRNVVLVTGLAGVLG
jgi:hypothetical protein